MNDSELRSKLIRIAAENPGKIRTALLSILAAKPSLEKEIKNLARSLKIPSKASVQGNVLEYYESKGQRPLNLYRTVYDAAIDAGWKAGGKSFSGTPDGSSIGSGTRLYDNKGNEMTLDRNVGSNPSQNWVSIRLVVSPDSFGKTASRR